MLHRILFAPFPDAAAEARVEVLHATLAAAATEGVLLVNLPLPGSDPLLALVQPSSITVLQLLAAGGTLSTPRLMDQPWLLNGQPLPGFVLAGSPWRQFEQQRAALAGWLSAQPEFPAVAPADVAGLVVCLEPVQFGADVEAGLQQLPLTEQFQVVPALEQLSRRLQQLEPQLLLPPALLHHWAGLLQQPEPEADQVEEEEPETEPSSFVAGKLRQLWGWLGAEDVPADPPYGTAPAAWAIQRQEAEQQQLEQLRQQMVQEMQQQRQAMEAREAQQEASIAQLRQQLSQAPSATAEVATLQARLNAEMREKQQLQQAIQASSAETEARNQALDARIQQLGRQLEQLQRQPASLGVAGPVAPAPPPPGRPAGQPAAGPGWRLQWARAALVVVSIGVLGAGLWGVTQLPKLLRPVLPAATQATRNQPAEELFDDNAEAAAPTLFDIQPDTLTTETDDSAAADAENIVPSDSLEKPARAGELLDSVAPDIPAGDI